jgi:O-antigen/teichoic acid export membrane protein
MILSLLAAGGTQMSVLWAIPRFLGKPFHIRLLYTSALFATIPFAFITAFLTFYFRHTIAGLFGSQELSDSLLYMTPALILFAFNKVLQNTLNGMGKMRSFAVFQSMRYLFFSLSVIIFLLFGFPTTYFVLGFAISELLLFIIFSLYISFYVKLPPAFFISLKNDNEQLISDGFPEKLNLANCFWLHTKFGLGASFANIFLTSFFRMDVIILGLLYSDKYVGIYSFAIVFTEGLNEITHILRKNTDPVLGAILSGTQKEELSQFIKRIGKRFSIRMSLLCLVSIIFFPVLSLFTGFDSDFSKSWGIFAIIASGIALSSYYRPFLFFLNQSGKPLFFTFSVFLQLVFITILSALFISFWGLWGAAFAVFISYLFQSLMVRRQMESYLKKKSG